MSNWLNQVADYFLRLETALDRLDQSVQQIHQLTQAGRYGEIEQAASTMQAALQQIDHMVADRQTLLQDPAAPSGHRTVRNALAAMLRRPSEEPGRDDARMLLDQCTELGQRMETIREQAIALFVCQFHLSETTDQILRLMFPQADANAGLTVGRQGRRGGRLLDQAG